MTTTIDAAGRLVVPKEIRRQAGIRPNSRLEVRFRDGKIEIEPAPVPVRLERKGRLVVAVAPKGIEALSADIVERARRDLRRSRSS
jgi:AbrB family looped-hinge helix DNA binding protein